MSVDTFFSSSSLCSLETELSVLLCMGVSVNDPIPLHLMCVRACASVSVCMVCLGGCGYSIFSHLVLARSGVILLVIIVVAVIV